MTRTRWTAVTAVLAAIALAACAGGASRPAGIAIVGATVLGAAPEPLEDAVVVIYGAQVAALGTRAETAIPKGAVLVDGRGRWLAPGEGETRVAVGAPATLVLLDGDPRAPGASPRVVRRFVAGVGQP